MNLRSTKSKLCNKTEQEAYDFLVKAGIIVPGKRIIEGAEKEQVLTMLRLKEPVVVSDNQHSHCEDYIVGDIHYQLHSWDSETTILEEIKIG